MLRLLTLSFVLFSAFPLLAQPADEPANIVPLPPPPAPLPAPLEIPRPKESAAQIEYDLEEFAKELNQSQSVGSRYAVGGRFGFFGANEWLQEKARVFPNQKIQFTAVDVENLNGDSASAKVFYRFLQDGLKGEIQNETLSLQRQIFPTTDAANAARNGLWGIVLPSEADVLNAPYSLAASAFFTAQKPGSLPLLRQVISQNRLKWLGLGAAQFVQDWDEIYRFDDEHKTEALRPYLKNDQLFEIPGTKERWRFNDKLSNESLANIAEATQTVLFYDGEDQKLNFRWNDVSPVCFADGHVELISRERENTLIWKP